MRKREAFKNFFCVEFSLLEYPPRSSMLFENYFYDYTCSKIGAFEYHT